MPGRTDADIPETGAIFTFGKSSFVDDVPSQFWLKNDRLVEICCIKADFCYNSAENGRLLMFGGNTGGQLGLKIKPDANKPTSVKALKPEKVKLVACGRDHTLVCTLQHCVCGAGRNQKGQLGLGHKKNTKSFQLLRPFCESAAVKMLAAGSGTSAALTEEGRLFMWGDNSVGQIGLGDKAFAAEPRELNVGQAVMWVSCGHRHSAFVTVHGGLYTFGESANGRLGLQVGQLANHRVPQQVQGIMGSVIQVCCGGEHTVALTEPEEDVYTFGRGQYGQLGHGTFEFELHLPKPLERFHNSSARRVACGESHTAVITNAGLLYTFGDGRFGKLGLQQENFINQFSPTLCTRFLKYSVQSVSCGGHHTLVLAVPRPAAQSQDFFWESDDPENVFKDSPTDPAPVVPLSALAARARHRKKKAHGPQQFPTQFKTEGAGKEEELSLKSRKKKARVTSQNRQDINSSKTKPPEVKDGQSKLYKIKSTNRDRKELKDLGNEAHEEEFEDPSEQEPAEQTRAVSEEEESEELRQSDEEQHGSTGNEEDEESKSEEEEQSMEEDEEGKEESISASEEEEESEDDARDDKEMEEEREIN
uniref:X-linked retinitis pigmentosa GTPase regulator n=1 Tax=Poecilia formosa TaxID=48698 RepID=A0A096M0I0_POEFO